MSVLFEALYPAWTLEGGFFGDYNYLDSVIPPDEEIVRNYQLSIIKGAIDESSKTKWFLVEDLIYSKDSLTFDKDEIVNEAIQKIFENIDDLRAKGKKSLITATKEVGQQNLKAFENILMKLCYSIEQLNSIDMFKGMFIQETALREIDLLIKECENFSAATTLGSWGTRARAGTGKRGSARKIMGMLNGLQGALLEAEGTAWFAARIPEIETINTAKVEIAGKGQMISDILFYNAAEVDLWEHIQIRYRVGGKRETKNLKDFLNHVKTYNGTEHIIIESGAEEIFAKSIAGVQAKSGKNQSPFNANKQNSFSIGTLDESFYKTVLEDLGALYYWGRIHNIETGDTSEHYDAIYNYAVSTKIPQIMQFNKNQFLLTRKGLISYLEYFYEEMLYKQRYFHAAKPISISNYNTPIKLTF